MSKDQAINYMIREIEKIERDRLSAQPTVESSKHKKEVVEQIINKLKGVQIEDENKHD